VSIGLLPVSVHTKGVTEKKVAHGVPKGRLTAGMLRVDLLRGVVELGLDDSLGSEMGSDHDLAIPCELEGHAVRDEHAALEGGELLEEDDTARVAVTVQIEQDVRVEHEGGLLPDLFPLLLAGYLVSASNHHLSRPGSGGRTDERSGAAALESLRPRGAAPCRLVRWCGWGSGILNVPFFRPLAALHPPEPTLCARNFTSPNPVWECPTTARSRLCSQKPGSCRLV
jgi:hypothetical protein